MLDNSKLVKSFVPDKDDGDTFIYTEMLQRGVKKGNNGNRLVKTFYHRSKEEFDNHLETIKRLCDLSGTRAMTRLAPKSYKQVAKRFLSLVTETYITENYAGMKTLYNRACGTTTPINKLWLIDCDSPDDYKEASSLLYTLAILPIATIPSKKGTHIIVRPFNLQLWTSAVGIHKDNPTNLYIPEGAE